MRLRGQKYRGESGEEVVEGGLHGLVGGELEFVGDAILLSEPARCGVDGGVDDFPLGIAIESIEDPGDSVAGSDLPDGLEVRRFVGCLQGRNSDGPQQPEQKAEECEEQASCFEAWPGRHWVCWSRRNVHETFKSDQAGQLVYCCPTR
jgi:hypothetical protein